MSNGYKDKGARAVPFAGIGPPLEWGPSPSLEDPVTVAGYPLGGDNSSVTQVIQTLKSKISCNWLYVSLLHAVLCTHFLWVELSLLLLLFLLSGFATHILLLKLFPAVAFCLWFECCCC